MSSDLRTCDQQEHSRMYHNLLKMKSPGRARLPQAVRFWNRVLPLAAGDQEEMDPAGASPGLDYGLRVGHGTESVGRFTD
jgi:hypothetical protein